MDFGGADRAPGASSELDYLPWPGEAGSRVVGQGRRGMATADVDQTIEPEKPAEPEPPPPT